METPVRPDPDTLLSRVQEQEQRAQRGRLKVFFGATAGVGKTYTMLEAAQRRKVEGVDVVVGYVEPHGRVETERLLEGLERLPFLEIEHRGARLHEFDLAAALSRKPQLILVDELAHTNAAGALHAKRWHDIDQLLSAGIDVYTTVNVQHLESINDIVAQITGVQVQETVPDTFFERADEVELVDLAPDDLLQRLREGKVYLPDRAQHAMQNFFRKGNLIALRELALRKTAERVDAAMQEYREDRAIVETWSAGERLLVCLGPGEGAENLVRAGKRLATALHAEWIVVYVETPDLLKLPEEARNHRIAVLRQAELLGAEAVTLGGASVAQEILHYARLRNVTRIMLGDPTRRSVWRRMRPSTVDLLLDRAGDIDITVVKATEAARFARNPFLARTTAYFAAGKAPRSDKRRWAGYAWSVVTTLACTAICFAMTPSFELANLVMVYLLGTTIISFRFGRGPAVLASVANVAAFDFFFVPPRYTFAVTDMQYVVTFTIMFAVALLVSYLTARVRLQARVAGHRERRTAMLYAMSRELTATRGAAAMARVAVKHTGEVFEAQVVVLLPDRNGRIAYPKDTALPQSLRGADLAVAQWVMDNGKPAGLGTDSLPGHDAVYLPLRSGEGTLGLLALLPANPRRVLLPEQAHLLETFAAQIALSLERAALSERAYEAAMRAQDQETRNALLASISHDLRTPLAAIVGAASALAQQDNLPDAERQKLAATVSDQAQQMTQLVNNVLDLMRLEGGALSLHRDWYPLDELVGTALERLRERLKKHRVAVAIPRDLPPVFVDGVLLEQVFYNLLENAAKHTPTGTMVEIDARATEREITVTVADNGPGLRPGDEAKVFEKFHRGHREPSVVGIGLGLTICRAIIEAHGGSAVVESRAGLGAVFKLTLPRGQEPPPPAP